MRLIIATENHDKIKEIKKILDGIPLPVISLKYLRKKFIIKETGKTFFENAFKKAFPVSKSYKNDYVAADDSGLEVEYLGGAPGVFSKRYSGKQATYLKNNFKILKELEGVDIDKRAAYFYCCVVLMKNGELIKKFEGKLKGLIHNEITGEQGFGYDPVFYLSRYKKTVAELPLELKNKISHRAQAFRKLKMYFM